MQLSPAWDEGTKRRLIEAAGAVFARQGFRAATIREICKHADASISAVNYHFRDKAGLYAAVFEYSHQWALEKYPQDMGLKKRAAPEEKLRAFVRSFLFRGLGDGFPAWHGKLIAREIADPSGILHKIARTAIRPIDEYLEEIIRELIRKANPTRKADARLIHLCRMNIVGQCIFQIHDRQLIPFPFPEPLDAARITAIADRISCFSLGGIQALAAGEPA